MSRGRRMRRADFARDGARRWAQRGRTSTGSGERRMRPISSFYLVVMFVDDETAGKKYKLVG